MVPPDGGASGEPSYVYCAQCGAKASVDWSFCRSCDASLGDAESVEGKLIVRNDGTDVDLTEFVGEPTGCLKCGHTEVEVHDIGTTGQGFSRLLDVQSRRFRSVACSRCGYTELYSGRRSDEAVDLFMR
jgi:hypothetical protein